MPVLFPYNLSEDYTKLKELLDKDQEIVFIWQHDTTLRVFSEIAKRIEPIPGGVDGPWYSLGPWHYFPTINKESFEEKCKYIGLSYLIPSIEE